jgi:hypothetical protein
MGLLFLGVVSSFGLSFWSVCDGYNEGGYILLEWHRQAVRSGVVPTLVLGIIALYSDWALGIMVSNLVGAPSGDNQALFWGYWIAKRLAMLSA